MRTRELLFVQVDVFTERVFGGNPLAVVFEGAGLSDARDAGHRAGDELLGDHVPAAADAARLRGARADLHPAREMPFAGHPTIGTAWVLATEQLLPPNTHRFNLEEGIGPVEVTLEGEPTQPSFLWMRHGEARFGPELIKRAGFARALGLAESDLLAGAPICTGSTGNTFLYIPLRDREVVDRARLDVPALLAAQGEGPNLGVFVFAPDPGPEGAPGLLAHVRAPHVGHARGSGHRLRERAARGVPGRARARGARRHGGHRERAGHAHGPPELHPHPGRHDARAASARSWWAAAWCP